MEKSITWDRKVEEGDKEILLHRYALYFPQFLNYVKAVMHALEGKR